MTLRAWGAFHLVPPGTPLDSEDLDTHVVRTYRHGPSNAWMAEELWRLGGQGERADRVASILSRAWGRSVPMMNRTDIGELLDALEGLEGHVGQALLDERWHIRADKMDDIRRRSQYLAVDDDLQAPLAVSNAFANVGELAAALTDAQANDLEIVIG